jgi:hypothetical protein
MRNDLSPLGHDMVGRFRPSSNWFVASRDTGVSVARSGAEWQRFDIPLPDLRDALGRLRCPVATYGGEEITVFGPRVGTPTRAQ